MFDLRSLDRGYALSEILSWLEQKDFTFIPPTPATHARVLTKLDRSKARDLRDVFGWSLPFCESLLEPTALDRLEQAGALEREGSVRRSRVRGSRVHGALFLHSAYPTNDADSVFLGPDSYRFADFVLGEVEAGPPPVRVIDVGAGAGVGGIVVGRSRPETEVVLTDVNAEALLLASVNARHAGVEARTIRAEVVDGVEGAIELALANPPYVIDAAGRTYRDGGDMHGARRSLEWATAIAPRLRPGGRLLLYTGSAIVDGRDALRAALEAQLPAFDCTLRYREIDPDVFGDELKEAAYADVERIAAVGAVIVRRS